MVKALVVYDTKYGNTKLVAEEILEGLKEVEGVEAAISDVDGVDLEVVADSDAILIGSPNHMGGPSRVIRRFIDRLGKLDLKARWFAVFDTYLGRDFEKAVRKMEKRVGERAPGLRRIAPGLSVRVRGMKGPVPEEDLPRCRGFGRRIADQLRRR